MHNPQGEKPSAIQAVGNEMMKRVGRSYQLSVYLKGDSLDPAEVSGLLCVEATKSHAKGKGWITSSQKEVTERTGLWALVLQGSAGEELSALVARMKAALEHRCAPLVGLPGVQEAYLDVLALIDADDDGGGNCEFILDIRSVADLHAVGLPVKFTVAVIVP